MGIGGALSPLEQAFRQHLATIPTGANILELGCFRWEVDRPTHHGDWMPEGANYIRSDISEGTDVDIAADAHRLTDAFPDTLFDAILAVSVWEHLEHPWIAAQQLYAVMKPGARALIVTHHTFPRHGYPSDYTRWDQAGLDAMFRWAGFPHVDTEHAYPCQIIPPPEVTRWSTTAPAWLNVVALARR